MIKGNFTHLEISASASRGPGWSAQLYFFVIMKNSLSNTEEQRSEISIVDVQLIDTDSRAVDFDTELCTDFANSYTVLYIFASFMLSS